MCGQGETGTQILGRSNCLEAFFGVAGELFAGRRQQIGIGLVVTAANPAAQLMQLSQAKLVGSLENNGVGVGYVNPGFDDGGGNQYIETAVIKIAHDLFQRAFRHLPVADADARFGDQRGQIGGALFYALDFIVQVVNLTAAQQFAQYRFLDDVFLLWHDEGADRQPARRWCGDDRQLTHAGHGHVQGAGNRCGGQCQHIHFTAQGLELLLLAHAKAVFFVYDHQPQVLELDVTLQQLVGPDHDVHLALSQRIRGGLDLLGRLEARHDLDLHRPVGETVTEAVVVLLRQQRGGHQYRHLLAAVHREEGGTHGDFGLAKTDIATHQAVHGLGFDHVVYYRFNRGLLIGGFLEREGLGKDLVVAIRRGKAEALSGAAAGIDIQQLGGDITDLFRGLAFGFLPLFRAQAVQGRVVVFTTGIAGDQVQVGNRYVELGFIGVGQGQKLGLLTFYLKVDQPKKTPNPVINVYHRRAFTQFGQVANDRIAQVGGLATAATLHHPLAKQLIFGNQCHGRGAAVQALIQRRNDDADAAAGVNETGPVLSAVGLQLNACQQFEQGLTAAGTFSYKQGFSIEGGEELLQRRKRLIQFIVQRQVR